MAERADRTWKLLDILREASGFFVRKGLENPRLQAELLLAHVLRLKRVDLYLQFDRLLTDGEVDAYRECVRQRARRRPLQYITGTVGFRQIVLEVEEGVLVPRPETEEVAGAAVELVAAGGITRVLDLGCGSGAIAISVAWENPAVDVEVVGVDLDAIAVANAQRNARRLGVQDRVRIVRGDLFGPLRPRSSAALFGLIVSNPPYIPRDDIAALEPEVRDYEPRLALDGGADGLEMYRRIVAEAGEHLVSGGHLLLEVGAGQAESVAALVDEGGAGLETKEIRPDLNGIPRVLIAGREEI